MTTEEILKTFKDINYAYNNCTKYDTLKRMLDELLEDIKSEVWDSGMNMTGEYQGVWIRCRNIEKIIDKYKGIDNG